MLAIHFTRRSQESRLGKQQVCTVTQHVSSAESAEQATAATDCTPAASSAPRHGRLSMVRSGLTTAGIAQDRYKAPGVRGQSALQATLCGTGLDLGITHRAPAGMSAPHLGVRRPAAHLHCPGICAGRKTPASWCPEAQSAGGASSPRASTAGGSCRPGPPSDGPCSILAGARQAD